MSEKHLLKITDTVFAGSVENKKATGLIIYCLHLMTSIKTIANRHADCYVHREDI